MKNELKRIADIAWQIALDNRSSRIEKLEALKLVCACKGVLLPDLNENFLSVRQVCQLRQARQTLVEKALRKKARRKVENRRAYLRRAIAAAKTAEQAPKGDSNE